MPLTADIDVPAGQTDTRAFVVTLRITNPTDRPVAILNPDLGVPSPEMKWTRSQAVYQAAMLLSFHYLGLSVMDGAGRALPEEPIPTWATPVLGPPVEIAPGRSLELAIPLGAFFPLEAGETYRVAIEYGERGQQVGAQAPVTVP